MRKKGGVRKEKRGGIKERGEGEQGVVSSQFPLRQTRQGWHNAMLTIELARHKREEI